jgi:hypothetical protein
MKENDNYLFFLVFCLLFGLAFLMAFLYIPYHCYQHPFQADNETGELLVTCDSADHNPIFLVFSGVLFSVAGLSWYSFRKG